MNLPVLMSLILGFCAVCYGLLGLRLVSGKREIGSVPLGIVFMVIGYWVLGGAIGTLAQNYVAFMAGRLGHFIGTSIIPVTILVCFREFVGRGTSTRATIALLIVPVVSIVVAATNYWHQFMWVLPDVNAAGQFLVRPERFGPYFWFVHLPYGYAAMGTSIATLVMGSTAVATSQRRALFLLAGSAIVPVFGIVAYDLGIGPDTVPTIPVIFAFMLPVYAWLVFGERIAEFTPLAYETVFQNMQDPVIVLDDDSRIIGLNYGAESLLNLSEQDALRMTLDGAFGVQAADVHAAIDTGVPQKMLTRSGRFLHLQVTPIATNNAAARNARVLMFRDVSDVERAQREVQNSEKLLRTLIDHSVNGVVRLRWVENADPDPSRELRSIFANAAAGRYLQRKPDSLIGCRGEDLLALANTGLPEDEAAALVEAFSLAARTGEVFDRETRVRRDNDELWLRVIAEPVGEDVAVTFIDVTDRILKERQMESIALSDPLTGVLNRRGFERDAARRLTESADDATGALLFIDLNDFKAINDRYGHEVGDQLLMIAAKRLQKSLRNGDIIGRPGGDEFVALVPDVDADVADRLATRLTRTLERSYLIGTRELHCAASIGLALYPEHADTLTGLLRAADAAMYRAKERSRGGTTIGDTDLLEKAI